MFDDLKIRNKLVLLVAGPIVIIVLLSALGARSRQDTAASSRNVEQLTALARANSNVVDALQTESLQSTVFVASGRTRGKADMATARKATDGALDDALARQASLLDSSASFRSAATLAADGADKLDYIRSTVDQGYQWKQIASTYAALQSTFIEVNNSVATNLTDPQVANDLRSASALARYKLVIAQQGSTLVGALEQGVSAKSEVGADGTAAKPELAKDGTPLLFRGELKNLVISAQGDADLYRRILDSYADKARKGDIRDALTSKNQITFDETVKSTAGDLKEALDTSPEASANINKATIGLLADLHVVETGLYDQVISRANATRTSAERAANLFLLAAAVAILAAIAAAILLGRRITRPLDHLTKAADELSTVQMPRLVEWLRNPSEDDMAFELGGLRPIEVESNDEIGKLASSFNDVQRVAGEVAAEQAALLRKGIGEMFVNLARRNQALLDRQIDFIDELERSEEDPDQLENLYRLDHLATRMRRNAESLLVLAGAEPPRRRGRPAPLANVVRAALAEVEDFGRIDLLSFDEILVASNVAADLAHLLSELMENATNFSPPETRVEVVGHRTKSEGYMISVTDHGIGMSSEQILEANDSLAKPPLVGLALSRSLGFIVVGRLAGRHGVSVRMMQSPSGGVTAVVSVPANLITDTPNLASEPRGSYSEPAPAPAPQLTQGSAVPAMAEPAQAQIASAPPLSFSPGDRADNVASTATGPVARRAAETANTDPATGLPNRRAKSDANDGLPTRRPFDEPMPTVDAPENDTSAPAASALPEAIVFAQPATVNGGSEGVGAPHLDGPPPPAPSLPPRAKPARTPVATPPLPATGGEPKPFFLDEAHPPRLFGRPQETAEPAAGSPAKAPEVEQPEPKAPPATVPAAPAAAAPAPVAPAPVAPAPVAPAAAASVLSAPAEPALAKTTAGLAKRAPRAARGAPGVSRAIPGADGERGVSATRRSPDEVRNLLSGFRAGQDRARTEEPATAGSPEEEDANE